MSLHRDIEFRPLTDPEDPDDWRPNSRFALVGNVHGTRNTGEEVVEIRAFFPSAQLDIRYIERNPAPGTEGEEPQPPVVFDARTGAVSALD